MLRLVARASSNDEAKLALNVLRARGVYAGSDRSSVVLPLTTERGLVNRSVGVHQAANAGEVRAFAAWAVRAGVSLALSDAFADEAKAVILSREMVESLAGQRFGDFFPCCQLIELAAERAGRLAGLREGVRRVVEGIQGANFWSSPDSVLLSGLEKAAKKAKARDQRIADLEQKVADLEQKLEVGNNRIATLAHQRNVAIRKLRGVRRAIKVTPE